MQIGILLDAQTEPELPSPRPPVEAIGRALPSTSTCVELANLIDSASGSPAVTESPAQIDTLPRADYCLARQTPAPNIRNEITSTIDLIRLGTRLDTIPSTPIRTKIFR